ncbi:hypothetical protein OCU04_000241 [Sclerotinia nivalis]|uniref:Uncharacterized protein n=1 Tax=Sclerotinia nivalis TaxID=352851 RepID=A0A9X0DQ47_9HELO|nr:hypothetical protein OCU04_000241 [Sclerotinia nivalis]
MDLAFTRTKRRRDFMRHRGLMDSNMSYENEIRCQELRIIEINDSTARGIIPRSQREDARCIARIQDFLSNFTYWILTALSLSFSIPHSLTTALRHIKKDIFGITRLLNGGGGKQSEKRKYQH